MSLRELAAKDGQRIFSLDEGGVAFTLIDENGCAFECSGIIDDIGFSIDAEGAQTAGRTATAAFPSMQVQRDGRTVAPCDGWTLVFTDLHGVKRRYAVSYAAPDLMLSITRVYLRADLSESGEVLIDESNESEASEKSDESKETETGE